MSSNHKKDVDAAIRKLRKLGCTATVVGSGHWMVARPGHRSVIISKTPSDWRGVQNMKANVRRHLGIHL